MLNKNSTKFSFYFFIYFFNLLQTILTQGVTPYNEPVPPHQPHPLTAGLRHEVMTSFVPTQITPDIQSRGSVTPAWKPVISGSAQMADVIFLIDGSGSVRYNGQQNWGLVKNWVKNVASAFEMGLTNGNVRLGLVQYSHWYRNQPLHNQRYIQTEINIKECKTLTCFKQKVDDIDIMGYTTYTGAAINKTVMEDFTHSRRQSASQIMILLTDGPSVDEVRYAAEHARNMNITIFSIGVNGYNLTQLQLITSGVIGNNLRIYRVSDFEELQSTAENLQREVKATYVIPACTPLLTPIHGVLNCTKANEVGSTCSYSCHDGLGFTLQGSRVRTCSNSPLLGPYWTGKVATCGVCSTSFDLLIILDSSSSIGFSNFLIMKDFVRRLIDTVQIGPKHVQVSLITYHSRVRDYWNYDTYSNKDALQQAIRNVEYLGTGTRTGSALYYALDNKFGPGSGRRQDKPHVTVLITDGKSQVDPIETPSRRLHEISQVVAIGIKDADQSEIDTISSDPDSIYSHSVIGNFVDLFTIINDVATKLCGAQNTIQQTTCQSNRLVNPSSCFDLDCTNLNQAGSVCNPECCQGYVVKGDLSSRCLYNGNWSSHDWKCVEKECPPIKVGSGEVIDCSREFLGGSNCSLTCKEGFKLVGNGTENCETLKNGELLKCNYSCEVNENYKWDFQPYSCKDIDHCDQNKCMNGDCVDELLNYTCDCKSGYEGIFCETEINECDPNPCENKGICTDLFNDFSCNCSEEYVGEICSYNNPCNTKPCGKGKCMGYVGGYMCICNKGFTGVHCLENIDDCDVIPYACQNGGKCIDGVNDFKCNCAVGYEGVNCSLDVDECLDKPCFGGTCIQGEPGSFSCNCSDGYTGERCEIDIDECSIGVCDKAVNCTNMNGSFICDCLEGYQGRFCEDDIDECLDPNSCGLNNICTNLVGTFSCACPLGFTGDRCESRTSYCMSGTNPCKNKGICSEDEISFKCSCDPKFKGVFCEISKTCDDQPCKFGYCNDTVESFKCECFDGYKGIFCTDSISVCDPNPCLNGGTCTETESNLELGYICSCTSGFTGSNCQIQVNEDNITNPSRNSTTNVTADLTTISTTTTVPTLVQNTTEILTTPSNIELQSSVSELVTTLNSNVRNNRTEILTTESNVITNVNAIADQNNTIGTTLKPTLPTSATIHSSLPDNTTKNVKNSTLNHENSTTVFPFTSTILQTVNPTEILSTKTAILDQNITTTSTQLSTSLHTSEMLTNQPMLLVNTTQIISTTRPKLIENQTMNSSTEPQNITNSTLSENNINSTVSDNVINSVTEHTLTSTSQNILNNSTILPSLENNTEISISENKTKNTLTTVFNSTKKTTTMKPALPTTTQPMLLKNTTQILPTLESETMTESFSQPIINTTLSDIIFTTSVIYTTEIPGKDSIICLNNGTIVNNGNEPMCNCGVGYTGAVCEIELCRMETCHEPGDWGLNCTLRCPHGTLPVTESPNPLLKCLNGSWVEINNKTWGCRDPNMCPKLNSIKLKENNQSLEIARIEFDLTPFNQPKDHVGVINTTLHFITCTRDNIEGSVCRFGCRDGYKLVGPNESVCNSNGNWSGNLPKCATCPIPATELLLSCTDGHKVGSTCGLNCPVGLHPALNGRYKTCDENLQWQPLSPDWQCEQNFCDLKPPRTIHGFYVCSRKNEIGSYCESKCFPGFIERRSGSYNCTRRGDSFRWEGLPGSCMKATCDKTIDLRSGETTGFIEDDYANLVQPPTWGGGSGDSCNMRAVLSVNTTYLSSVSVDLWYSNPSRFHFNIGDKNSANGLVGTIGDLQLRDLNEVVGYNDVLLAYSDFNFTYHDRENDILSAGNLTAHLKLGNIFQYFDHVSVEVMDDFVQVNNHRNVIGSIGPAWKPRSHVNDNIYFGLNRLANLNSFFKKYRTGSGLCFVCINSTNLKKSG